MPELSPFAEVALRPVTAAAIDLVGTRARPPLIVSFIVLALVAGPLGLDVLRLDARIALWAEPGITVPLDARYPRAGRDIQPAGVGLLGLGPGDVRDRRRNRHRRRLYGPMT